MKTDFDNIYIQLCRKKLRRTPEQLSNLEYENFLSKLANKFMKKEGIKLATIWEKKEESLFEEFLKNQLKYDELKKLGEKHG